MKSTKHTEAWGLHGYLSAPHPQWETVAQTQMLIDKKSNEVHGLPIQGIRRLPYRPASLSTDAPVPGHDTIISQKSVAVRDGTEIMIRIHQPMGFTKDHPLYFDVHGGGWTVGSPETAEGQS
ncbi:alpha/beta hydrolase fold-3 domain-containing protein [Colletotrichum melonis]|uniref:Alpha/beta hydrolase fold-3 domain-containing protein n=1 Tax=Colletotrichum melonis TaxID=1209925 RepID=A0AAI9XSL8_9PEZI|nr:alpha/beta hydrolase fold-3 domain-containing protein [Colletotrichum melonis]